MLLQKGQPSSGVHKDQDALQGVRSDQLGTGLGVECWAPQLFASFTFLSATC